MQVKKEGRTLARPEFREETPRRRTAEPPKVIHAAPHKIMIAGPESTPQEILLAALGISHGSATRRDVCCAVHKQPTAYILPHESDLLL
jgi:hypothetical protein